MDKLTPLLDRAPTPEAIRQLRPSDLQRLAEELRAELISAAAETGGHFGGGLGVVELTIALHYVFDTPRDKLIWDVSHQAYPHKLLTGRRKALKTIRKKDGLYGFTKRSESAYDPFGAAHSSTSISAGLGMAVGRDLKGLKNHVIAVIGDGAITGGMAYEALNHAGGDKNRLIVIVNDNGMSIGPAVGALSDHLVALRATPRREGSNGPSSFFETLGFRHLGPIDGHNLDELVTTLTTLRDEDDHGPVVVHVVTEKGRGHPFSKPDKEHYHAVGPFNAETLDFKASAPSKPTYTQIFADELIKAASVDPALVAITAAMGSGTGLDQFGARFPKRYFDVGIAEQHAVTFAAGLATEGLKPFCAIYSTFLQRAYDQLIHDVALQNLPVRFAIDRAGLVGQDGATHAGSFDLAYLSTVPNMVVMAPSDAPELRRMVATAAAYDEGPIALRYPRGESAGTDDVQDIKPLEIGKGRILVEGEEIALIALGSRVPACLAAAHELREEGIVASVIDARFAKPIDTDLIEKIARTHRLVLLVEEGAAGGFSAHVLTHLARAGLLGASHIEPLTLPDRFIAHGSPAEQLADAGLDSHSIAARVRALKTHTARKVA